MVAAKIATLEKGQRQDRSIDLSTTQDEAATLLNVSVPSVKRARQVLTDGTPELVTAVEQGKVAVSTAADLTDFSHDEQQEIVARGEKEIIAAVKEIRSRKREIQRPHALSTQRHCGNEGAGRVAGGRLLREIERSAGGRPKAEENSRQADGYYAALKEAGLSEPTARRFISSGAW